MFGRRRWYVEVFIIGVILPLVTVAISLFIPFPYSWLLILTLYIAVIISRIRKKALTVKEAVVLVLIIFGVSFVTRMFSPIYPPLVSITLTFLVVWLIHKSSA